MKFEYIKHRINNKLYLLKKNVIKKYNRIKKFIVKNLEDLIVFIALVLITSNSILINFHFGIYITAAELIIIAYKISKRGDD